MPDRPYWSDDRLADRFKEDDKVHENIDEKLEELLEQCAEGRREARAEWLKFFAPVAVALIGLLGTIITLLLTAPK